MCTDRLNQLCSPPVHDIFQLVFSLADLVLIGDVHPHCRGSMVQGMAAHDHEFKTVPGSKTMRIHYDRFQEAYAERKAECRRQQQFSEQEINSEFAKIEKKLTTEASL